MAKSQLAEQPNIFISNGTCYSGPNHEADPAMIPCGNSFYGAISCCQAQDACLLSGVCFNFQYYTTYISGCTDSEYKSPVCPNKFEDKDAPWLGMSYCNGTSNQWVLCDQKGHPGTIVKPDLCYCPTASAERSMTLSQYSQINETAWLPSATGLSVQFFAGFFPTAPSTIASSSATATSNPTPRVGPSSARTSNFLSPTVSSPALTTTSHSNNSLTTGDTIGIAVSASIGGVALLAGLVYLFLHRRRTLKARIAAKTPESSIHQQTPSYGGDPNGGDHHSIGIAYGGVGGDVHEQQPYNESASQLGSPHPSAISELDSHHINKAVRPWSLVSELDGENSSSAAPAMGTTGMPTSPGRMEAIMENGGFGEEQAGPSELSAHELTELPA
ncbi:hypothetical protein M406DRAFT_343098 [Cryphonectria parasitica EP155]|uniref:Uncharacterized protein n=1 Tax=Cryphonectria parasitica (strain ATCC 38755 / EP155) TaxID=660469 RepID=A0A9P5CJC7_CRYP1|nr:uncharacterized protein M406DRAFT_343098 [Cryphonectria parasitica EP155]KAF3760953.1 hypothetical protein M406DRAFT_343098 [Cryphonectria parasitica EP155]